jgi:hypothetical protein
LDGRGAPAVRDQPFPPEPVYSPQLDVTTRLRASLTTEEAMTVQTFDNGLTPEHDEEIDNLMIAIVDLRHRVSQLGRHRSYSLAETKLEEASHWLRDRKFKPA